MKIVFFGTPDIAAKLLETLVKKKIEIVGVVTKPDTAKKRSNKPIASEVKAKTLELLPNTTILQPIKCSQDETKQALEKLQADLFVVAAFGEIISQDILDIPPLGCINVHTSYLPKLRGAAPMQRALMQGDTETGVCIIRMVRKMDAGNVLRAEKVQITPDMTLGELEALMVEVGSKVLLETIEALEKGPIEGVAQDETKITFAHKITPEDCLIDWNKPVQEVHNRIRALSPKPGAYCFVTIRGQKKRLKILKSKVASEEKSLIALCLDGDLQLLEIQLEGKSVMQAEDFLKGTKVSDIIFE